MDSHLLNWSRLLLILHYQLDLRFRIIHLFAHHSSLVPLLNSLKRQNAISVVLSYAVAIQLKTFLKILLNQYFKYQLFLHRVQSTARLLQVLHLQI
jgi:hypothetical protein